MVGLFAMTILATACSKDDDDNGGSSTSAKLVGEWAITDLIASSCDSDEDNGSEEYECTDEFCWKFKFYADGKLTYVYNFIDGDDEIEEEEEFGTYRVNGNQLELCDGDDCGSASYTLSGSNLTISQSNDEEDGCDYVIKMTKVN